MSDTPRRVFGVLCVMVVVWIATYWLYEPSEWEPKVTFGEAPEEVAAVELAPPEPPKARAPDPAPVRPAPQRQPIQQPQSQPRPRVEPPAFREYVVQPGDRSLETIAQRELGDRRLWRVIAEANPFLSPDKLYPGRTVIRIPLDPTNVQGRLVEAPAGEGGATPSAPVPEPAHVEYTIAAGDTLSGISQQFYGDPNLWRAIFDANRDVLRSPDRLPRGAKIKIPPKPAR